MTGPFTDPSDEKVNRIPTLKEVAEYAMERADRAESQLKRYEESLRMNAPPRVAEPLEALRYGARPNDVPTPYQGELANQPQSWQDVATREVPKWCEARAILMRGDDVLLSTRAGSFDQVMVLIKSYVQMMGFEAGDQLSVVGLQRPGWSGQRTIDLREDPEGRKPL